MSTVKCINLKKCPKGKFKKGYWSQILQFWLRNAQKLPHQDQQQYPAVYSLRVIPRGFVPVAIGVRDMQQVTCDT